MPSMSHLNEKASLLSLVTDVSTEIHDALRRQVPLYRNLNRSLMIFVAEIVTAEVSGALNQSSKFQKALHKVAISMNAMFREILLEEKYKKHCAMSSQSFFSRFLWRTPGLERQESVNFWKDSPYRSLWVICELLRSPHQSELRLLDLLSDDRLLIKTLTTELQNWNDMVDQIYTSEAFDNEEDADFEEGYKDMLMDKAVFHGETSVRILSRTLFDVLHNNWPCNIEDHVHTGRLGHCLGAKLHLDLRWNNSQLDPASPCFFVMLTGSELAQECQVHIQPTSMVAEENVPVCLVEYDESQTVCIHLVQDGSNRLLVHRQADPPKALHDENHTGKCLGTLFEVVNLSYVQKRVLGVILARSVLHLLGGPWISQSLCINDIFLVCKMQDDQPHPVFDKLFLSTAFRMENYPSDRRQKSSQGYNPHRFPTILALGMLLAEIELGDEIPSTCSPEYSRKPGAKSYRAAKDLLSKCERRLGANAGLIKAITFCISRESFEGFSSKEPETLFSSQEFVSLYYMNVVRPLEDDLVKGAKWTWEETKLLQGGTINGGIHNIIEKLGSKAEDCKPKHQQRKGFNGALPPASSLSSISELSSNNMDHSAPQEYQPFINGKQCFTQPHQSTSSRPSTLANPAELQSRDDFEIAIICALPLEADAVIRAFDELLDYDLNLREPNDPYSYSMGILAGRKVVVTHPPQMGKVTAARVAATCAQTFRNLKLALVVGVCGGVPIKANKEEILLGDVVISKSVIQYDFGRQFSDRFERKISVQESLGRPSARIGSLLAKYETQVHRNKLQEKIFNILRGFDESKETYPEDCSDRLYEPDYRHKHNKAGICQKCATCKGYRDPVCDKAQELSCKEAGCDETRLVKRQRYNQKNRPWVHIGSVGSADRVVRSAMHRDQMAQTDEVVAFEMEGAGVWDILPCVIIKGVSDYSDSHKNKEWQNYAAAAAAACMKAFIQQW